MSSSESKQLAGPVNRRPSLPVIFATAPVGQKLPCMMRMWPLAFDRVVDRADHVLALGQAGQVGQVLGQGLAGHGEAVAVQQAVLQQQLEHGRRAATACRSSCTYLPLGRRSHRYGTRSLIVWKSAIANGHVDRPGHGQQVEHGVRRSAQGHHQRDRVLERLAGHDVAGLDVLFETDAKWPGRRGGILQACPDPRPATTRCRAGSCPSPQWPRPWCWRCTCRRTPRRRGRRGAPRPCALPRSSCQISSSRSR